MWDTGKPEASTATDASHGAAGHLPAAQQLCGPCNRAKSNTLTLSGLRRLNQKNGWMAKE